MAESGRRAKAAFVVCAVTGGSGVPEAAAETAPLAADAGAGVEMGAVGADGGQRAAPALMRLSMEMSRRRSSLEAKRGAARGAGSAQMRCVDEDRGVTGANSASAVAAAAAHQRRVLGSSTSNDAGPARTKSGPRATGRERTAGVISMNRRLRRVLNDLYLKRCASRLRVEQGDSAEIDDPEELKELFAVSSHSVFADLHESKAALAAFSPFSNVTEEQEAAMLQELSASAPDNSRRARRVSEGAEVSRDGRQRLDLIDGRARSVMLGRTEVVAPLIEEVESRLADARSNIWNCAGELRPLELVLGDAFHRLVAHGVAQYYRLRSVSASLSAERRAVLLYESALSRADWPSVSLLDTLRLETVPR